MTEDCITIRHAGPDDAPAIAAVHVASWRTTYAGIVAHAYIDSLSAPERAVAWDRRPRGEARGKADVLLAESPLRGAMGFVSGGPVRDSEPGFDAELYAMYLLHDAQGAGLGRRLAPAWATVAIALGFRSAMVRVLARNPARHFYEHGGAQRIKESHLDIGGNSYPEIWYGWHDLRALTA